MKKLYEKDPVLPALIWIGIYVLGFGNADMLSEMLGVPRLLTAVLGLLLCGVLLHFVFRNRLGRELGLCRWQGKMSRYLYFMPLILLSTVNLWFGAGTQPLHGIAAIVSMVCAAVLEELIFRGLLLRGMLRTNGVLAIAVSSLTFGIGHLINLLMGQPPFQTGMQLIYATATGFCYSVLCVVSGSLLPGMLSHICLNVAGVFVPVLSRQQLVVITVVQTVLSLGYGGYLLSKKVLTKQ